MLDERFKDITKDKILEFKKVKFNNMDVKTSNFFDPKLPENANTDLIDKLREEIRNYERKYIEDFEMCMICEMAIAYLDIVDKNKEEVRND